ncbi:MAG TPA: hypothetical protein VJ725_05065 [Thermoanaerobaculia bacterium]|nr:hypothetical protein [Thermoanaerobaculia bacterium]
MRRLLPILSLLVVAFTACSPSSGAGPSSVPETTREPPPREVSEPQILEAVFRYQFEHNASAIQDKAEKYCLTLTGGGRLDGEFLRRFEGNRPPVVAADQCDRRSGRNLFFQAKIETWESDSEAVVRGGYYEGNLSSSRETFRVVWEDGRWVVEDARLEVIS